MLALWELDGTAPFFTALGLMLGIAALELVSVLLGMGLSAMLENILPDSLSPADGLDADGPDVDGPDADGPHAGGGLSGILGWLCIGRAPLLMLLVVFLTVFGLMGLAAQALALNALGRPLPAILAALPAAFLGLLAMRGFGRAFAQFFPRDASDAVSGETFIGRVAVIVRGEARKGFPAEAKLRDQHAATHYLLVEPDVEGEVFHAGDEALLVSHVGGRFRAIRNPHPSLSPGEKPWT